MTLKVKKSDYQLWRLYLGQTSFQHFPLAEIVDNNHAKSRKKIGGKWKNYALLKMPSVLGKKEEPLLMKVSDTLVGFHLTTGWIPITYKGTVFILHPHFAC